MRAFATALIVIASTLPVWAQASHIIANGTNTQQSSDGKTHTLEIRCDAGTGSIKISRVAVLDVPGAENAKLDFGLTTAHGLLDASGDPLNNCRVKDFKGHKYELKAFKAAVNYQPGTPTDWAVIAFTRAGKTDVIRYSLAAPLTIETYDNFGENQLPLIFSSARGLPNGGQSCKALPRRLVGMNKPRYVGLLPHDCRAVAGQSGAPLSIVRQGKNVMLGFHVGNAFWIGIPEVADPARHGYMRVVDDELMSKMNINISKILEIP